MWRSGRSQDDFNSEIESHLQLEIDRLMEEGATEAEARAAARKAFGNVTKTQERFYEHSRWLWAEHLLRDVRYAARVLRKTPSLTAVAVFTMALGIAASSTIFTVVDAVLLRPLPYPEPDRLVMCVQRHKQFGPEVVTLPDFRDWRERSTRFAGLAGVWSQNFNLTEVDEPERLRGASVIGDVFRVLGTPPHIGRTLARDDERGVVVLGYGLWQRQFGGRRDIIGKSIKLNGRPANVIGVMPAGFAFPAEAELWVPLVPEPTMNRGYHQLWVVGRLKRDATIEQAQTELAAIAAHAERESPATNKDWSVQVARLQDHIVGSSRRSLLVLAGATACLLLLACANVAGLLMSRSVTRRQEMAIRTAVGAGRLQIVRQLLCESVLLSMAGGGAGLAVAAWSLEPLLSLTTLPRAAEVALNTSAIVFTLVAATATGLVFGLLPALAAVRASVSGDLTARGISAVRLRPALVTVQIALATVLLAGSGLLIRSFHRLLQVDTGFNGDGVLAVRFFLPRATYPAERCAQLYPQMIERMTRLAGVEAAAAVSSFPFSGVNANVVFDIPGRAPAPAGSPLTAEFRAATPRYFRTLGIPLAGGRDIADSDSAASQFVAVVNRAMAARFFDGRDPIGQYVRILGPKPRMIVGVIDDIRHRGLDTPPQPEIYVPHTQFPTGGMFLAVRTRYENPLALANAVRAELKNLDAALPMTAVQTLDNLRDQTLSPRRFSMVLLTVFAASALILALVGTYGMISFNVSQRTKEIGIRMAVGAAALEVVRSTVRAGMIPVAIGLAVGLAGALGATRVLKNLLFEIRPNDPVTMAAVLLLLLIAAALASLLPALRAARVDPMVALRQE